MEISGMDGIMGTATQPTCLHKGTCPYQIRNQVMAKYGEQPLLGVHRLELPDKDIKLPIEITYQYHQNDKVER